MLLQFSFAVRIPNHLNIQPFAMPLRLSLDDDCEDAGPESEEEDLIGTEQNMPVLARSSSFNQDFQADQHRSEINQDQLLAPGLPLQVDFHDTITSHLTGKSYSGHSLFLAVLYPTMYIAVLVTLPSFCLPFWFPGKSWAQVLYGIGWIVLLPFSVTLVGCLNLSLVKLLVYSFQPLVVWVSTLIFTLALMHHSFYDNSTFAFVWYFPSYIVILVVCACLAVADSLHPRIKIMVLRFVCPVACTGFLLYAIRYRLPGADATKGKRSFWFPVGYEAQTSNLDISAKFGFWLLGLLARGVWKAWRNPHRFVFFTWPMTVARVLH